MTSTAEAGEDQAAAVIQKRFKGRFTSSKKAASPKADGSKAEDPATKEKKHGSFHLKSPISKAKGQHDDGERHAATRRGLPPWVWAWWLLAV